MSDLPDIAGPHDAEQRKGRRTAVLAAASVAVVAVLGGGAWAAAYVLGGHGPQPEDVLPASTLAEISVDMDPSASQKVAAYETLRKFPALKDKLGASGSEDPRRAVFDQLVKDTGCAGVDFDKDVKPWLGERAALAAVDLAGKNPSPALAVQVSDEQQAKAGIQRLVDCGHPGPDFGYVFADGYAVVSDSTAHARTIATAGRQSPLSADKAFTSAQQQVGARGVVNFYVASRAAGYLTERLSQLTGDQVSSGDLDAVKKQLSHFRGLSGTVRFADGGVELTAIGRTDKPTPTSGKGGAAVAQLPSDTALAFGFAAPRDYASRLVDQVSRASGEGPAQFTAQLETMTGLRLPQDVQTLLGQAVTFSVGGEVPDLHAVRGPADLPLGATITGDTGKIQDVIHKVEERQGVTLDQLGVAESAKDGRVALASSRSYAAMLATGGNLGQSDTFRQVVPEAGRSAGVFYLDFDSKWVPALLKMADDSGAPAAQVQKVRANLAPLRGLGVSSWTDGDTGHVLVKLSTD